LLLLSLARSAARVRPDGTFIPLDEQDITQWDASKIERGEQFLRRAYGLGKIGRFQLEAAIQSVHCARAETGRTDWPALRLLHEALLQVAPTLGAEVSLAAVVAETEGADAGLNFLDHITTAGVERFQPAWAARAHLLARAARWTEAASAYEKAISLTTDAPTRAWLKDRADAARLA
jgi:predicted RNA polymerase sigma factor